MGAADGTLRLWLNPRHHGDHRIATDALVGETVEVPVVAIDSFVARESIHPVQFIKIDVQGMEIEVLEGMAAMVKRYRPKLLVELHAGVSRPQFLDVINSLGYLTRGFPVEPLPGESEPVYANRTYFFQAAEARAESGQ